MDSEPPYRPAAGLGLPSLEHTEIFRRAAQAQVDRGRRSRLIFLLATLALFTLGMFVVPYLDAAQSGGWQTPETRKALSSADQRAIARLRVTRDQRSVVVVFRDGGSIALRSAPGTHTVRGQASAQAVNSHGIKLGGAFPSIELGSLGISRALGARDLSLAGSSIALDRATLAWLAARLDQGAPVEFE